MSATFNRPSTAPLNPLAPVYTPPTPALSTPFETRVANSTLDPMAAPFSMRAVAPPPGFPKRGSFAIQPMATNVPDWLQNLAYRPSGA